MNNQQPVGNNSKVEFTQKALDAKFSFSFTRAQLIILFNVLNSLQLKLGDLDTMGMQALNGIRAEIKRAAITSITASDYVNPLEPIEDTNLIKTN